MLVFLGAVLGERCPQTLAYPIVGVVEARVVVVVAGLAVVTAATLARERGSVMTYLQEKQRTLWLASWLFLHERGVVKGSAHTIRCLRGLGSGRFIPYNVFSIGSYV